MNIPTPENQQRKKDEKLRYCFNKYLPALRDLLSGNCLFLKMITRLIIIILLLLNFFIRGNAQTFLNGKIYEATTDSLLYAVNIFNATTKLFAYSRPDGSYTIAAAEGDHVLFSATGFMPDTVTVTYDMLLTQYVVKLSVRAITLNAVTVTSSYQADSLARRTYYQYAYKKQPGITGGNRPADGVGIVLSPSSFFSQESRQKRKLKKRLIKNEREAFIDYSFPVQWVEKLTGLHGDSLRLFMYRYRPSYSFCRKTSREGMLVYINDKLKEFKSLNK